MPDPTDPPPDDIRRGWTTERILLIITAFFSGLATLQSKCNNVESRQDKEVIVQKVDAGLSNQAEVKEALNTQTAKADKAQTMRATGDEATQEANILYFQRVLEDPDASDAQRAKATDGLAKAKAALAELKTKNGKKS